MAQEAVVTKKQASIPDPAIQRLGDMLIGSWTIEGTIKNDPTVKMGGENTYEWLPGGFFLFSRWRIDYPKAADGFNSGIMIVSFDATNQKCLGYYFDQEGTSSIYVIELEEGIFRILGEQNRLISIYTKSGDVIMGQWETFKNDAWEYSYDVKYVKQGSVTR
jgi:hypothetical protein